MATTTRSCANSATVLHGIRHRLRADGPAAILGIGTANPKNCVPQDQFADWYLDVTKSEHLAELKAKTKKICDRSGITKRYFYHTEEIIGDHPELIVRDLPSLTTRLSVIADAAPKLAAEAASRAIADWGRPAADITHLVVATNAGANEPGVDQLLAALLGLRPTVRRTLLYLHGCSAGLVALRVAKDVAENNRGARVLVACAQAKILMFGAPDDDARLDKVVPMTLFGDGAGAIIVGADPTSRPMAMEIERPIFHMVSASQTTLPGTDEAVVLSLRENGLVDGRLSAEVPRLVGGSLEQCLAGSLAPLGLVNESDGGGRWNGFFWAVHPGGRAILDSYEATLGLQPGKLAASRHVLSEYGNMMGSTIIFVLDEIRHRRRREEDTKEKDCQFGVMSGVGPGLTVETIVLHAATGSQDQDEN
ncbi:bisdemethoxycurcumin synthase [Zea mays]|uniref:Type III polyketide synthase B n=2 Tax=Zea mays TaxID=4577 RepID=A0A804NZJ1_MAIZE|nr:bisdemethoxycurcumin synthase [Zea mays]|eukprot:XP_008679466.1 bisdemethoxycurcumin synthase [Zea mays]